MSTDIASTITSVISNVADAVNGSDSAEEARAKLAQMVRNQDSLAKAAAARAAEIDAESSALLCDPPLIPLPNGQTYHVRYLGEHHDVAAFRALRKNQVPFMLYGPPGTGKTAGVEAAFAADNLFTVLGSGDFEVSDLIGSYVALPGGSFEWVDGPLVQAMTSGGVLFVDEIGLIDPKVLSILYSVMDGRGELTVTANPERGTVRSVDGFFVCAATNPNAPGVRLSEALLSRFSQQILVKTDYKLASVLGVDSKIVQAAQNMQRKVESGELSYAPQLRELLAFKKISGIFGDNIAVRNVISGAPEMDRPVVRDVLERTYGMQFTELEVN